MTFSDLDIFLVTLIDTHTFAQKFSTFQESTLSARQKHKKLFHFKIRAINREVIYFKKNFFMIHRDR